MAEPTKIWIDNEQYNVDDISESCKQMLAAAQNGQQGVSLLSAALDMARVGLEQSLADAKKLLPDPVAKEDKKEEDKKEEFEPVPEGKAH